VRDQRNALAKQGNALDHPLADQTVWRIRVTTDDGAALRAAVVHDPEHNVVWMCRVVKISDFPHKQEENAYKELGLMWKNSALLPTDAERADAAAEAYWHRFMDALSQARAVAEEHPGNWVNADVNTPLTGPITIGSAFFEKEEHADGSYTTRWFVIVSKDPAGLARRPADWLMLVDAELFDEPDDEIDPPVPAREIPGGRWVDASKEIAFRQSALHFKR
jgi:hypothetical protein